MARSTTTRWWLAGACLAISASVVGAGPAIAGSSAAPAALSQVRMIAVTVAVAGPAIPLPGAMSPTGPMKDPNGDYPAAPDPAWPAATTPTSRFTASVAGGDPIGVACLDRCAGQPTGFYAADPSTRIDAVATISGAVVATAGVLPAAAEASAVQAAVWFRTSGFVLDADVDPLVRQRVATLVAAAASAGPAPSAELGVLPAGTVLVGGDPISPGEAGSGPCGEQCDPSAPRLVLTEPASVEDAGPSTDDPARSGANAAARQAIPLLAADQASTPSTTTVVSSSTTTTASTSSATGTGTTTSTSTTSSATSTTSTTTFYPNCTAVWAAIGRSLRTGQPGYSRDLDRDGDGFACEQDPRTTNRTTSSIAATTTGSTNAAAGSDTALPTTGFDPVPGLGAGAALMLMGGSLVILGRRRRPAPAHRD